MAIYGCMQAYNTIHFHFRSDILKLGRPFWAHFLLCFWDNVSSVTESTYNFSHMNKMLRMILERLSNVTLCYPPTISSLKITDRSFRYASLHLWNQLPESFRQSCQSCLDSSLQSLVNLSLLSSPLSASYILTLFHSRFYLFNKSFSPY